jgi:hypothetical protein
MDTLPRVFSEVVCDTLYVVPDVTLLPSWDALAILTGVAAVFSFVVGYAGGKFDRDWTRGRGR